MNGRRLWDLGGVCERKRAGERASPSMVRGGVFFYATSSSVSLLRLIKGLHSLYLFG